MISKLPIKPWIRHWILLLDWEEDKNKLEIMKQCNAVYKISCLDCDVSYRPDEKENQNKDKHKNIKKSKDLRTIVSEHQLEHGHELDWDNISVLDSECLF